MSDALAAEAPEALRRHLEWLHRLRGRESRAGSPPHLQALKRWQAERLARTYEDLHRVPRYRQATTFFLEDLYGPKDFSGRDEAMLRIYPAMVRILPRSAVESAALAIEVDALSEDLDRRMAAALPDEPIDAAIYARAYRETSVPAERERQIALIDAVGRRLDALVVKPMVYATLKLMRQPARLAGLSDLQSFLERGFEAFRAMKGADDFLETIAARETAILKRLFSGHPSPFSR